MLSSPPRDRWQHAADILDPPHVTSTWECDQPNCDGLPHTGWSLKHARASQREPAGSWFVWLVMAGRGYGKTRVGAEWIAQQARQTPGGRFAVVARTTQDCREVCLEGMSGLLAVLGLYRDSPEYNRTTGQITLPNGATFYAFSAEKPDRMRGPNLSGAWCDEIGTWTYPEAWTHGLIPALRIGHPRVVVTTTPRQVPLVRDLANRDDGSVVITRGSSFENAANLSPDALEELRRRYEGTRLGRQELYGELIEDVEGALWNRSMFDYAEQPHPMNIARIVVAVDPAVTSGDDSDDTGIIVAALGRDGDGYVLADETCHLSPDQWASRVVYCFDKWEADRVIAEANNGGDLLTTVLKTKRQGLPVKLVHAARGKQTRAEPVAALYEQGRVHHVGGFPDLEDQMCTWVAGEGKSPDRVDAAVWALTELMVDSAAISAPRVRRAPSRWKLD